MMESSNGRNGIRGVITTNSACVVRFQVPSKELRITESLAYSPFSRCDLQTTLRVDPAPDVPGLCSGDWICKIRLWMWRHNTTKTMAFEGITEIVPPRGMVATREDVVHFSIMGQHFSAKGTAGRGELTPWISRSEKTKEKYVALDDVGIVQIKDGRTGWPYIIPPSEILEVELVFPITPTETTIVKESSLPVQLWDGQPANRSTDCVLISRDGKRFPCYRSILAARSTVFAAMFQNHMQERSSGDCNIDDIDGNVLEILLEFLYTNRADTERVKDAAEEVYNAAEKYAVVELCTACEKIMVDNLSVKTALSYLNFAVSRGLRTLKTRTIQFMNGNIEGM